MSFSKTVVQPRILVTGASGYIGRQVLRWLTANDFETHATSRVAPRDAGGVRWIAADCLDAAARRRLIETVRPTHLLHLAWITTHGAYWTSPQNIDWLNATLDLARLFGEFGGQRLVGAGTCVELTIHCDHARLGTAKPIESAHLYSISKRACAMVLGQLAHDFGFRFAWGRVFFSYGEHEHPARLVPSVIKSLLAGQVANCTSGTQRRDFMDVRDLGAAFSALLLSDCEGQVDLGIGEAIQVADVVRLLGDLMDKPNLVRLGAIPNRPGEPDELVANATRLRDEVGFTPRFSLEQGLRDAIAWWAEGPGSAGVELNK
jgi:nucleoside-diphosphate-sugar epimerase